MEHVVDVSEVARVRLEGERGEEREKERERESRRLSLRSVPSVYRSGLAQAREGGMDLEERTRDEDREAGICQMETVARGVAVTGSAGRIAESDPGAAAMVRSWDGVRSKRSGRRERGRAAVVLVRGLPAPSLRPARCPGPWVTGARRPHAAGPEWLILLFITVCDSNRELSD